jgi:hypothetical protein
MTASLRTWVAAASAALLLASCSPPEKGTVDSFGGCQQSSSNVENSPPLQLVVCSTADSYDALRVPIFIGIRNLGIRPYIVDARFDIFGDLGVQVFGPEGERREFRSSWEPGDVSAEREPYFQYVVPNGGVFGRVIDLACDVEDLEPRDRADCQPLVDFDRGGVYNVRVEHVRVGVCEGFPCLPEEQVRMRLEIPPLPIRIQD